ncbi:MAG: hypothetical protein WBQ94_10945 [Terracidiphilus sp.]
MQLRSCLRLAVAFTMLQPSLIWAQTNASYALAARIDESTLTSIIASPSVQSFDLSPDGKTVALLVATGFKAQAPLWLVTEEIATKRFTAPRQIGHLTILNSNFSSQVRYTSDQQNLVVQDFQTIRVFDSKSFEPVRTISSPSSGASLLPLFITGASSKDVFVCAFGSEQNLNPRFHTTAVQVEVVDISSGAVLGQWASEDVPQSISSNGDLVAVSSLQVQQGVLPLSVVDVHGKNVTELTGGYSFKDADQSKPLGRVTGLFMGSQELLIAPDENVDPTGHHSGESLQLVGITGKVEQTIKPRHYGSTGELAASADQKTALALSWYVPARALAHEGALPASTPEVLVLGRGASLHLDSAIPIEGLGLRGSGWLENRRPRLSSDGSVIAVAQRGGITVLTKKLGSRPQ